MKSSFLLSTLSLRSSRVIRFTLIIILLAILLTNSPKTIVHAADGDLDPTFGVGGKVTTDFANNFDDVSEMIIQPDGRIIVVGATSDSVAPPGYIIVRYQSDGSLDPAFGAGGKVASNFSSFFATSVALQSDGKIIVAGSVFIGPNVDFGLTRYNSNGSLDTSFGTDGKVTTDFFGFNDVITGIAIQSNGRIVVAGTTRINGLIPLRTDFALARYNLNGSLDLSFGSGGKVATDFFGFSNQAEAIAIQPDGKIIAAGGAESSPRIGTEPIVPGEFAMARYNADGSLDSTFGWGGKVTTAIGSQSAIKDIARQADGHIIAAGLSGVGPFTDFTLVRYNGGGGLDTSFGSGGIVITDIQGFQDVASAVKVQADGKIIVAGDSQDASGLSDFALVRYSLNGGLDPRFGTGGKTLTDFFGFTDIARAMAIQPDGRIIAAGYVGSNTQSDIGLARYLNLTFDLCLQDDSNGNLLQINTTTGDYQFTNCAGLTIGGTGTLTKRGNQITLQHNASDRRVMASIDSSTKRATASIQLLSQGRTFSITDRNITNNTCTCR